MFATPELIEHFKEGGSSKEKTLRKVCDAQPWWDLGVILYLLCTGGVKPFFNANKKVWIRLVENYIVVFPKNLPYSVSEELQQLIRDLLSKSKDERLGYTD